jgi:subtilisin
MPHQRHRRTLVSLVLSATVLALTASDRILNAATSSQEPSGDGRVDVLIAFHGKPGSAEDALVRAGGGEIKHRYHLVDAIAASLPAQAVNALRANPRVRAIEPDGRVFAIDAELDDAWGVKRIGAGVVHQSNIRGAGVKVAVLDTGIDYNHADLSPNYYGGFDFVNDDNDPFDDHRHGTHVAGTIAARDNNSGVVGVAPEAHIYALKVLGADGSGSFSAVIAALQWAVEHGIQITNNSYGSSQDPGSTLREAFDNAAAAGMLHIAAAGNTGTCEGTGDNVGYPARYASVMAVAATGPDDESPCFSSTGPDVEISAPGVSINSTVPGGGYQTLSGTSMAAPHVAGTAALIIDNGVSDANGDGRVNADDVREILNSTAHDLNTPGRDTWYGFGLVDALAATGAPGERDPEVSVSLSTDKSSYTKGADSVVKLTAEVTDENGRPISRVPLTFATTLDGSGPSVVFSEETETAGRYTGFLGIGSVPMGSHTVALVVTDADGVTGTDSTSFFLNGVVRVTSISHGTSGGPNGKHLSITVAIGDENSTPVAGASVSVALARNATPYASKTGPSNSSGNAVFEFKNAPAGCYVATVSNVSASGRVWNGVTAPYSFCK